MTALTMENAFQPSDVSVPAVGSALPNNRPGEAAGSVRDSAFLEPWSTATKFQPTPPADSRSVRVIAAPARSNRRRTFSSMRPKRFVSWPRKSSDKPPRTPSTRSAEMSSPSAKLST
eukprot:TRINITY_DN62872_c0_g1_i1.p2 TRINITY_DN62872_c0_g1~~TRINITY_DN62872_c0_g1_i1.p2  ORF type:complete len:117 (-),score=2.84 TRINITY_DN62872_c0_g1_i1:107-457(-)